VDQLAKTILGSRRAWWLGAGVSFAAGIPIVPPLRESILGGLGLDRNEIVELEEKELPFEALFEVLVNSSNCSSLFDVFRGKNPALAHRLIARLAAQRLLRTVVTTNFDTLMEDAFDDCGVQYDLYSADEEFAHIDWSGDRIRLIKLHGTLKKRDELAITICRVAAKHYVEQRSEVVRQLFEHEPHGVVVLGYSCSDHFDLSPAAHLHSRNDRDVWYVAHNPTASRPMAVAPLSATHPENPFCGYNGRSITCCTDDLLRTLWRIQLNELPPALPRAGADWQASVHSWMATLSSDGGPGKANLIAGLLLKAGNLWKQSNAYLDRAIGKGLQEEDRIRALLAIGNNHRDLGETGPARHILSRAESMACRGGYVGLQARILNSFGMIAADVTDLSGAIAYYEQVLEMQIEDRELKGKCHGNLGIALKNRNGGGDLDEAIRHLLLALEIAKDLGDKRSEGRNLGNIGLLYSKRGDLKRSCEFYREARRVAEVLGDLLHVGIWFHNEGEDTVTSAPDRARQLLECSRDVFLKLGRQEYAEESIKIITTIESHVKCSP
jgi:tetratricopeptide (TPR) repeat protein